MYATEDVGFDLPTEFDAGFSWQATADSRVSLGMKSRRSATGDWRNTLQLRAEKTLAEGVNYYTQYGQQSLLADTDPSVSQGVSVQRKLTESWSYNASVESNHFIHETNTPQSRSSSGSSASARDFFSVKVGSSWQPSDRDVSFKNALQFTQYDDEETGYAEFEFIGKPDTSWTVLNRVRGSYTDYEENASKWFVNNELGLSYRPQDDDSLIVLASLESNLEALGFESGSLESLNRLNYHTASVEGYWRTGIPLDISARYANRWSQLGANSEWYHTDLKVVEAMAPIWKRTYFKLGGRWLTSYDGGYGRYGAGVGLVFELQKGLEIEAGYNVNGFEDEFYRSNEYYDDGAYFGLRWVFDEESLKHAADKVE